MVRLYICAISNNYFCPRSNGLSSLTDEHHARNLSVRQAKSFSAAETDRSTHSSAPTRPRYTVVQPPSGIFHSSSPRNPGLLIHRRPYQGSSIVEYDSRRQTGNAASRANRQHRGTSFTQCPETKADQGDVGRSHVTINILPDDALIEIFAHFVDQAKRIQAWHTLVHVCQRWRSMVFSSTNRLDLQISCNAKSRIRKSLDVWPVVPVVISDRRLQEAPICGVDNVIAALEHHDRVRHIELWGVTQSLLGRLASAIQEPFPELTSLSFLLDGRSSALVLPDPFFGGSAPRLQRLHLKSVPFPPILTLLVTATDLVNIDLWNIPYSGYVTAEDMVARLAPMTRLKSLSLGFHSPRSCPDPASRRPPPPTRTILPALTHFNYRGVSEFLEDLVSQIDTPLLDNAEITFFNQLIFDIPRLPQFIRHLSKFKAFDQAYVLFQSRYVQVRLSSQASTADEAIFKLKVSCRPSDWQLSAVAQVCDWPFTYCSTVERLHIREDTESNLQWQDDMENTQWIELLRPFIAVKDLYLSEELAPLVALALRESVGVTDVLPALQNLFFEGFQPSRLFRAVIGPFIAARESSKCPVAAHYSKGRTTGSRREAYD